MTGSRDMRWIRRGVAAGALVVGWLFIAWQNHFHLSAPMVFVCLAYLAVVATIYCLWRTGVAVVDDEIGDSTWAKPAGALGELEREKRTLLKAIKEAEFDHQMGKLSKHDADDMIRVYRARAIDVIKEIDRLGQGRGHGSTDSVREQILREVRARLEIEARSKKADKARAGGKAKGRKQADASDDPGVAAPTVKTVTSEATATSEAVSHAGEGAQPAGAAPAEPDARPAATPAAALSDEEMDADSTTAIEPPREDRAKEATQ